MAELVYIMCVITSVACAALLTRSYMRSRSRLVLWSSICFAGLAINNALLFIDLVLLPHDVDLGLVRALVALVSLGLLIVGLVLDVH
jgi:hypothetical protein